MSWKFWKRQKVNETEDLGASYSLIPARRKTPKFLPEFPQPNGICGVAQDAYPSHNLHSMSQGIDEQLGFIVPGAMPAGYEACATMGTN